MTLLFAPAYPLETERLQLRPFTRADVDAVFAYRSLPAVAEYLTDQPMSHDECAEAVRIRTGQFGFTSEGDRIVLALEQRHDGRLIGEVSLIWRSLANGQAEIGYVVHPDFWGRGLATEAARAILDFGFSVIDLHRVYARCDARNLASAKVMERLGMRREAHFREHDRVKGRWDEEFVYAILRRDWRDAAIASD
ncbi:MAG: GNAT family protein [Devosia sp.]